ncbi:MAG: glycosyltransferase [Ferruginibacter sp.]
MKSVFISIPWFLPAYRAGGPVQSVANLVAACSYHYHFFIFTSDQDVDGSKVSLTQTDCWLNWNENTQVFYSSSRRKDRIQQAVQDIKPDIIFMIGIYDPFFTGALLFFKTTAIKILSVRGMLHPGALSVKTLKKKGYLQYLKWRNLPKERIFHATDEQEAEHIRSVFSAATIRIAGNFPKCNDMLSLPEKKQGHLILISVGLISPMKNIELVLQALQHQTGHIIYHIIGGIKDHDYWLRCLALIHQLPAHIQVVYHGEVEPDSVSRLLAMAQVFVLPSKSENFGHAIFEALSAGLPVITSKNTPWNNLEEQHAGYNTDLYISALSSSFHTFVNMDAPLFDRYRHGARQYAMAWLQKQPLTQQYQALFQ